MTENLTRTHKLVEEISAQGWLANPAGRQGYEVIVLERVGDGGSRFYCSLKPGETLRLGERIFGKYTILAVDIRHARSVSVEGQFETFDRGRKVNIQANVRYRVTDARVVAMDTVDPLGELRAKVISTLRREVARHREGNVTPGTMEEIIRSVGPLPHLGLTVEDAEVVDFSSDSRLTQQTLDEDDLQHQLRIEGIKNQATRETRSQEATTELDIETRRQQAELRLRQERHEAIDLTNINALMHEHPDMAQQVWNTFAARDQRLLEARMNLITPAIQAYIEQQREKEADINPDEIARIMRQFIEPPASQLQSPIERKLVWGDEDDPETTGKSKVTFSDEDKNQGKGSKEPPPEKSPRIIFGDDE